MQSFPWQLLLDWYSENGRHDFPWRQYDTSDTTGYRVWLAEILLQQTQADRVVPFYEKILSKYPTIEHLARASYDEFFPYYQWLGYYSRARNLLKTANIISTEYAWVFPRDKQKLKKLPGVGEYTARAILAFGYGDTFLAWDTNLETIFSRYYHGSKTSKLTEDEKNEIERDFQDFVSSPPEKVSSSPLLGDELYRRRELEGIPQKGIHNNLTHPIPPLSGRGWTLLSEIIWREFWYQIAYYFPFTYQIEFQERRRTIDWKKDTSSYELQRFTEWKTGYPLVDAAIRQLIETNWMHNRLRMVVASFLTKNLGIDWRLGEQFFKKYLIDYDEAVNYGNWQWGASVGADPKPVRIFNPLLQSEKFDAECRFIKKYVPELTDINPKKIHSLELQGVYYPPIVDQRESARLARERYRGGVNADLDVDIV